MLRIGVAQTHNYFCYDENLRSISSAIRALAAHSVDLVVFPECVVTGFNTGLKSVDGDGVLASVSEVRSLARTLRTSVLLPTPWLAGGGKFTNSALLVGEDGEIRDIFHKIGLNRGEDRLFVPGQTRSRVFELKGHRLGVLICVEASHEPWAYLQASDSPELILWPGFYASTVGTTWSDSRGEQDVRVRQNIDHWKVPIIQVTCASSPESENWPGKVFGGSLVLSARGKAVFSARHAEADLFVVDLDGLGVQKVCSISFNPLIEGIVENDEI